MRGDIMEVSDVNLLGVLLAAIATTIIGMVWYSPKVFGKIWMKLANVKKPESDSKSMLLAFFSTLLSAFVLSLLIAYLGFGVAEALILAFLLWLGFIATTTLGNFLWEGKPIKLYLLNNGYSLLNLLVMSAIIAAF